MIKNNILKIIFKNKSNLNFGKQYFCNLPKEIFENKSLNSLKPSQSQFYAYGHFFPKEWSTQKMFKTFDPSKKNIEKFEIIQNRLGEPTGKVMIKFRSEEQMKKYIDKYNQDYVITDDETQRIVILPFYLKTQVEKQQKRSNLVLTNPVRVSNLDFDITEPELRKLAVDFGEVTHIDISMRLSGINRGFATVYFKEKHSSLSFINFINDFMYKDRKLKAHQIKKTHKPWKKQAEEMYLDMPTYTFKANEKLFNQLSRKQASKSHYLSKKIS